MLFYSIIMVYGLIKVNALHANFAQLLENTVFFFFDESLESIVLFTIH